MSEHETVRVPRDVEVPTALVEEVTKALLRDHHMTFTGQFDRVERAHARQVAATAVATVLESLDGHGRFTGKAVVDE